MRRSKFTAIHMTLVWWVMAEHTLAVYPSTRLTSRKISTGGGKIPSFAISTSAFLLKFAPDGCTVILSNCSDIDRVAAFSSFETQSQPHVCQDGSSVPFMALYNRVADNRSQNLENASSCELLGGTIRNRYASTSNQFTTGTIRVYPMHGYGWIDIRFNTSESPSRVAFTIQNISSWHADPVERHVGTCVTRRHVLLTCSVGVRLWRFSCSQFEWSLNISKALVVKN